jgi:hypothetical protein
MLIMTILQILCLAGLTAGAVWWWQRRRRKRLEAEKPVADLSILDLIGVTGVLDAYGDDATQCLVRLRDHDGKEQVLSATVEDADEPMELGDELLVIRNPTRYALMLVVPNELPRLEDLPK